MSLRARFALAGALAVAITVATVSLIAYFVVSDRLHAEVDSSVRSGAERIAIIPVPELALPFFQQRFAGPTLYVQVVRADGTTTAPEGQRLQLPVTAADLQVAAGERTSVLRDVTVAGRQLRMTTVRAQGQRAVPTQDRRAVQFAREVSSVESTLDDLRVTLLLACAVAVVVAAALGLLVAGAALRPVRKLTRAAERVAETQDLAQSIDVRSRDEVGRLAKTINSMLGALDASREQQRRLVGDASHELRTPLTSLRTNIEVLGTQPGMPAAERERLLEDVTTQLQELAELVDDLVEMARDDASAAEEFTDLDLDRVLNAAVERVRLRAPEVRIDVSAEPTRMSGQRQHLERALVNVLDNACKWSPPDGVVEVTLVDGVVSVRDHGPGIDDGDRPRVFDRFYRATAARSLPGSGLGLAIVRRVVDAHDGSVSLDDAPGGGTVATIRLSVQPHVPASRS